MSQKHYPHKPLIEGKLEKLPATATDELWNDMQARLEAHMPRRKKRPFALVWNRTNKMLSILLILLIAGGSAIYMLVKQTGRSMIATVAPTADQYSNQMVKQRIQQGEHQTITNSVTPGVKQEHAAPPPAHLIAATTTHEERKTGNHKPANKKTNKRVTRNGSPSDMAALPAENNNTIINDLPEPALVTTEASAPTQDQKENKEDIQEPASTTLTDSMETMEKSGKEISASKESGLYAGVVLGADLSSVKFNKGHAGHSKGFIVGYAFNRKWSVESGIFFGEKKYVSPGKYFNPTHSPMPAGVNMLWVCGENYLYEIPLQVRHNFLTGRHNLFITAGLSSYLMREENYMYEYEYNGQQGRNYASYKKGKNNVFSVGSASIGYSYQLGRLGRIRVEPYLKLPVNELGINRIPITSTGLQVGLTRFLSR